MAPLPVTALQRDPVQ